ncbi:MAG: cupredoxin family copper-binding protein [Candidatus Nanoarchaeia archaeon]
MRRYNLLILALAIILIGCQTTDQSEILTIPEPAVSIISSPEGPLEAGKDYEFTWEVKKATTVEHTNIHTSYSREFTDRTDSEKQGGTSGKYKGSLTVPDTPGTLYIRAHARADGKDYHSQTETRIVVLEEEQASIEDAKTNPVSVKIKNFAYEPASIEVSVGTKVTWDQQDGSPHTITGEDFDSGTITKGNTFSQTFTKPGVYEYSCTLHPSMTGKITVR